MPEIGKGRAMVKGPYRAGFYRVSDSRMKQPAPDQSEVWYYASPKGQHLEFHLNLYDGLDYKGHLTFSVRLRKKR